MMLPQVAVDSSARTPPAFAARDMPRSSTWTTTTRSPASNPKRLSTDTCRSPSG